MKEIRRGRREGRPGRGHARGLQRVRNHVDKGRRTRLICHDGVQKKTAQNVYFNNPSSLG
ncbi:Hypothetical protein FKW44_023306 [Caligus rogercresseyi]|uniref:Uncharacterized protein n=1 Tax=Caligus rogercresseyi TaxID=217165 RepID=A0A7T8GNS7_CALRO|nr:Hypothetical protein FKW44_023306 [Caligus rogercresseyi]